MTTMFNETKHSAQAYCTHVCICTHIYIVHMYVHTSAPSTELF